MTAALPDGRYDAFVIDAHSSTDGATRLELTLISGEHKGEVLAVSAAGLGGDPVELIGLPTTLVVRDGQPSIQ